jgi:hypothetical protein
MTRNEELSGIDSFPAICFADNPRNSLALVTKTSAALGLPNVFGFKLPGTTRASVSETGLATPFAATM